MENFDPHPAVSIVIPNPQRIHWVVRTVLIGIAVGVVCFACVFLTSWKKFSREEQLCGAFHPVVNALGEFQSKNGSLPSDLTQLVPTYLPQLPSAPVADSVDYRVSPDGIGWQLSVRSKIRGRLELFVQRSSREFTPEERQQCVGGFHGWLVFKQP